MVYVQMCDFFFMTSTGINTWNDSGRTRTHDFHSIPRPLNALLLAYYHVDTRTRTHTLSLTQAHAPTLRVSRLRNTLPTWQPIALLVKSFPIGCTRIRFHFKEPAGSRAARHRRENITLLFRESRSARGNDRQWRWMDIDRGESAGKERVEGGGVLL